MNWFMWRQYRVQLIITAILLIMYLIVLAVTGVQVDQAYKHASAAGAYFYLSKPPLILGYISLGMPLLLGCFWGAPLFGKEYEDGTNKLIWAQSISRRKWLGAKLLWLLAIGLICGTALAVSVTWWGHAADMLSDRMRPRYFTMQYLIPPATTLFALALGAAMGAWTRRVLPALALTLGIFIAVWSGLVFWGRAHYQTPLTRNSAQTLHATVEEHGSYSLNPSGAFWPSGGAWITHIDSPNVKCTPAVDQYTPEGTPLTCFYRVGVSYQPASRFWRFQITEAAIYLALTTGAVISIYYAVLKRDA